MVDECGHSTTERPDQARWSPLLLLIALPPVWGLLVPWFCQVDPITQDIVQGTGALAGLGVVLATITIVGWIDPMGQSTPYRLSRNIAALVITTALIHWWYLSTGQLVPYLTNFAVLCLLVGTGLSFALGVYAIGRRSGHDSAGLNPGALPSVRTVFMLNASSIVLITALTLSVGLTARFAGQMEMEQGQELKRIASLVGAALSGVADAEERQRILNLWTRADYGAREFLPDRVRPELLSRAQYVRPTSYGYFLLDNAGRRHHLAHHKTENGALWLSQRADILPPVRAPNVAPVVLLISVLLLGAPLATWLVASDLKAELNQITSALDNLGTMESARSGRPADVSPGVPIPGNDEIGDLAAQVNATWRQFERRNQQLLSELRLAAQSDEAQTLFMQGTSRALVEPLTTIGEECEALNKTNLTEAQREDIAVIESATRQLGDHVAEIVKLSQLSDWSELPLDKSTFQIGELATDVLKALSERVKEGVSAEIATADNVLPIHADPTRIRQVLENLIDNALKFTEEGFVRVTIINDRLGQERPAVHVQIWDSGPGIPETDQEAIFAEFYRVADQRSVPGTGLGLAIARRLVERHEGRLWVESVMGEGSAFHLLLPVGGTT